MPHEQTKNKRITFDDLTKSFHLGIFFLYRYHHIPQLHDIWINGLNGHRQYLYGYTCIMYTYYKCILYKYSFMSVKVVYSVLNTNNIM